MDIRFYINDDGAIVASVNGTELEMFYLDTMCEFPEDACQQLSDRFQKLLKEVSK